MNELKALDVVKTVQDVIVLTYDLDTTDNPGINDYIKDKLRDLGWQDEIDSIVVRRFQVQDFFGKGKLPSSTLWKGKCTPAI